MMAAIIQKYLQHYSIAQIMQVIDAGVVLVGMYVFGIHKALYAIIAVYLVTKVSDGLIEGLKFSKAAYIITAKPKEIADIYYKISKCNSTFFVNKKNNPINKTKN